MPPALQTPDPGSSPGFFAAAATSCRACRRLPTRSEADTVKADLGRFRERCVTIRACLLVLALASGASSSVCAQPAADFYKSRQMRLIIGHAVGNDYDIGAR